MLEPLAKDVNRSPHYISYTAHSQGGIRRGHTALKSNGDPLTTAACRTIKQASRTSHTRDQIRP